MSLSFKEIAECNAQGNGEVPLGVLREAAKLVAESGEPIEISERKFLARRRAMLEDFRRAIEQNKIRWC